MIWAPCESRLHGIHNDFHVSWLFVTSEIIENPKKNLKKKGLFLIHLTFHDVSFGFIEASFFFLSSCKSFLQVVSPRFDGAVSPQNDARSVAVRVV